ncbi:hypothetical protein CROQUDRAFT_459521 [Cronartium quercuum f. sp. fusiforme G11]|uniref:Uncharacterized protein n=1 Tax=Cronartium quercuum f. sp. fusiforme G11 TaxID=708437 RepID=A0A9P6NL50_9BASI|nr:hypothetical protein CROQUDRAFT_459521 [Cronartium quercuum f. sp. fusiforme G11]
MDWNMAALLILMTDTHRHTHTPLMFTTIYLIVQICQIFVFSSIPINSLSELQSFLSLLVLKGCLLNLLKDSCSLCFFTKFDLNQKFSYKV